MKRNLSKAKLVIRAESNKATKKITTVSVFDNRTQEYWTAEHIKERGIVDFLDLSDFKETLNWNLNGDESKYYQRFGMSSKTTSELIAYVFD